MEIRPEPSGDVPSHPIYRQMLSGLSMMLVRGLVEVLVEERPREQDDPADDEHDQEPVVVIDLGEERAEKKVPPPAVPVLPCILSSLLSISPGTLCHAETVDQTSYVWPWSSGSGLGCWFRGGSAGGVWQITTVSQED